MFDYVAVKRNIIITVSKLEQPSCLIAWVEAPVFFSCIAKHFTNRWLIALVVYRYNSESTYQIRLKF